MVGTVRRNGGRFEELKEFVRRPVSTDGSIAYSEEEGTYSAQNYSDDIPEEVKHRRLDD